MELVLKLPENKPPFIGVLFQSEFEAERLNQSKVNSYKTYFYKLKLEPVGEILELTLCLDQFDFRYTYKLKYNPEKLFKFLHQTKNAKQFNFGHVVLVKDNHKVVQTSVNGAFYVLKINELKLLVEY